MAKENPNGANQYVPDPRQSEFLKNYLDPKSKTFSNAYQSGIKAGYEEEYAKVILSKELDWLSEIVKDEMIVKKAEKNLNKFLDEEFEDNKIKSDITKFVLERLNKAKYSTKTEVEHSGEIEQTLKIDENVRQLVEEFIQFRKGKI